MDRQAEATELAEQVARTLADRRRPAIDSLIANWEQNFLIRRATKARHHAILSKAAAAAGLDLETLDEGGHAKTDRSCRNFIVRERKKLRVFNEERASRQRLTIQEIQDKKQLFTTAPRSSKTLTCLWFVSTINLTEGGAVLSGDPNVDVDGPRVFRGTAGENRVSMKIDIETGRGSSYLKPYWFDFIFVWPEGPSAPGLARATSWIQPNGELSTFLHSGCFTDPWARIMVKADSGLGQWAATGGEFVYAGTEETLLDEVAESPGGNYVHAGAVLPFKDEVALTTLRYPVTPGIPIVAVVRSTVYVAAGDGGEAMLDITLNVPSVWIVVDPL